MSLIVLSPAVAGRRRTKASDVASPDTDQDEEAETAPDLVEGDIAVSEVSQAVQRIDQSFLHAKTF